MLGLWSPEKFDERIAAQQREATYLYEKLGMTVAMRLPEEVRAVSRCASEQRELSAIKPDNPTPTTKPDSPSVSVPTLRTPTAGVASVVESLPANRPHPDHKHADSNYEEEPDVAESIWGDSNEFV
jgi:hypothetical protein